MRVKLSYTVELGDVPFRLREIVKECGQGLLAQGDALENASYEQEIGESFLEQIDSVRRVLALIDDRLNDCYSGAVGYSQLLLQQRSQPDAQQHPQGPEFPHDAPTDWCQEHSIHLGKAVKRYKKTDEPKNVLVLTGDIAGRYSEVLYDSERWFVETKYTYSVGDDRC